MAIIDKDQIQNYLVLGQKTEIELRSICEGLGLSMEGTKQELFERLTAEPIKPQNDIIMPQAIPLRTNDDKGQMMPRALKTYLFWRQQMFNAKNNVKKFQMLTQYGKAYELEMPYILCPTPVLNEILKNRWYDPQYVQASDLINVLKKQPQDFKASIIQKPGKNGRTFIMLHVEPFRQAA